MSTTAVSFVGRERELSFLRGLYDQVREGRGAVVVLVGDPGIGKTRTAEELVAYASSEGAEVSWGTCYQGEAQLPFGPWAEALAKRVRVSGREEVRARLGQRALVLSGFVPELADDTAGPPATLQPGAARTRMDDAFAAWLVSGSAPHVLVLDDLHWADAASIELLEYVGRFVGDVAVLLVITMRDVDLPLEHPLVSALGELGHQGVLQRLPLGGLEREAARSLVDKMIGSASADELLDGVVDRAAGNPFYLEELAHHLRGGGSLSSVPTGVRQAVARRVTWLQPCTRQILALAAAFTRPFELDVLLDLIEISEEQLLDALDEAASARMLRALADTGSRFEFAHALVRYTLYDELSPSRKSRLHRRIARALETRPGAGSDAELAAQYHASRSLPGAEHGIQYALAAADQARATAGYREAVQFLRIADELAASSQTAVRSDILGRLAVAEAEALLIDDAVRTGERVLALEPKREVAPFLAMLALPLKDAGAPQELLGPLIERGLSAAGTRHDLAWARLKLAEYPVEILTDTPVVIGRWVGFDPEAVEIARNAGDELDYARTVELMDWRTREETEELLLTVERWHSAAARVHGLSVVLRSFEIQHGDFRRAAAVARRLLELAESAGSLPGQAYALVYLAKISEVLDDRETRNDAAARAEDLVARLGPGHRLHFTLTFSGLSPFGSTLEGARARWEMAQDPRLPPWMAAPFAAGAAAGYATQDTAAARRLLDELLPAISQFPPTTLNQNSTVADLGTVAWELVTVEHAVALRRLAHSLLAAGVGDYRMTSLELTVARMSALLGDDRTARDFFDRARGTLDWSGQRFVRALVEHDELRWSARKGEPISTEQKDRVAERFEELVQWSGRRELAASSAIPPQDCPHGKPRSSLS